MIQATTKKDRMLVQLLATAGVMSQINTETVVLTRAQQHVLQQNLSRTIHRTRVVRVGRQSTEVPIFVSSTNLN